MFSVHSCNGPLLIKKKCNSDSDNIKILKCIVLIEIRGMKKATNYKLLIF